eukprot:COSAG01_NODE_5025_length_4539_cov_18.108559_7_plen_101_part_00
MAPWSVGGGWGLMGARVAWLRRAEINSMDLRVYLSVVISVTMCIMFDVGAKFAWRNFPALYRHPQRANSLKFMLQLVRARLRSSVGLTPVGLDALPTLAP